MSTLFQSYWSAVIAVLQADAELATMIKHVGEVPEDEEGYPHIWVEDGGSEDWSTKTEFGIEAKVTLHIGSRYNGTEEIRRIKNKVHQLLHFTQLTPGADKVVTGFYLSDSTFFDPDGKTRHCVMNFNYLVCED